MLQLLSDLGWSRAELARRISVNAHTVGLWAKGRPPKVVMEYLRLMLAVRKLGN